MWPSRDALYIEAEQSETRRGLSGVTRRRRKGMHGFVTSRADYLVRQQLRLVSHFRAAGVVYWLARILGSPPRAAGSGIRAAPHSSMLESSDATFPLKSPNSFQIFRWLDSLDVRSSASSFLEVLDHLELMTNWISRFSTFRKYDFATFSEFLFFF